MFIKISPLVTTIIIYLGEINAYQPRDAISTFNFVQGNMVNSLNYSAKNIYSTPKSTQNNEKNIHTLKIRQAEENLLQSNNNRKIVPVNDVELPPNMYRQFRSNLLQSDNYQYANDGSQSITNAYHTSAANPNQIQANKYPKNLLDTDQFQSKSLRQGSVIDQLQSLRYQQASSNPNSNAHLLTSKSEDQKNGVYTKVSAPSLGQVQPTENLLRKDHLEPRLYSDPSQNHKQEYRFIVGHNIAPKQVVRHNLEYDTLHDAFPELFENIKLTKLPEKTKEELRKYIIHHESEHHTVPSQSQLKADENTASEHPFLVYAPKQVAGSYGNAFVNTKVNERLELQRPKIHGIHLNVARFYNIATSGKKASDMKIYSSGLNNVPSHAQAVNVPNLSHQVSALHKNRLYSVQN